jgi:putative hydrolase of the HAD superfamily
VRVRALIFDLWETIVDFDPVGADAMLRAVASRLGEQDDAFRERWGAFGNDRYVAPIRNALRRAGVGEEALEDVCAIRLDHTRRALVPRDGVAETMRELRALGYLLGMVSVCSEEVERLWPESALAGLFDAEVFSCTAGLAKPDPRAYLSCCEALGVEPAEALFVGDGANDELAGAERVGMRAVGVESPGGELPEAWDGLRIQTLPELLSMLP